MTRRRASYMGRIISGRPSGGAHRSYSGESSGQHGPVIRSCRTRASTRPPRSTGISAPPPLVEQAVRRGEGLLAKDGPLVVETGKHTGRSAKDKFIVRDAETESTIWWDNNKSMSPEHFAALKADFLAALAEKETLFVQDLFGGSQPEHRVRVRVINELAWHNLFIRTLLVRPDERRAGRLRARIHDHRPAELPRRSGAPRHPHRRR